MELTAAALGLVTASLLASAVETVEAFTIVLAMGLTRDWKSAIAGTLLALVLLVGLTLVAGTALVLLLGIAALRAGTVAADVLPVLMGAGIVLVVSLRLLWEGRRRVKAA